MTARIKISQAGLSAGVAGVSRTDGLATGALVTLEDVGGTGLSTFHLLWGPPEDTTAEASLAATGDPDIWTFSPTAAAYGSYEIELRDDGVPVERRIFGIRTPANQLLIPALNERASRHAAWNNDGADQIEACEQNANDFPLSVLNSFRYAGWWRSLYELYRIVEFGTGSIADHALALIKLVTVPAKSLLANAGNATGNVSTLSGSAAYQYPRVNSANNALEMATLAAHASTTLAYDAGTNTFQRAALTGVLACSLNSNVCSFGAGVGSTSVVNNSGSLERAALTGAITANQNSNATAFGSAAAKSVLVNATNGSAVPAFLAGSAALQGLRINAANNGVEFATLAVAALSTPSTVTNSTSANVGTSFSVNANTFAVGTLFKFEGFLTAVRGATPTACNLIVELLLGATVYATATVSIAVSGGGSAHVTGYLLCLSTGASGTFIANLKAVNDMADIGTTFDANTVWQLNAGSGNTAASGTTKNTTGALTLQVQARMSAAVANLSTTWSIAAITPVR